MEFDLQPAPLGLPGFHRADAAPSLKSIVEEYGGPEMAKLLAEQPDLVDDEDQPAVRSAS